MLLLMSFDCEIIDLILFILNSSLEEPVYPKAILKYFFILFLEVY